VVVAAGGVKVAVVLYAQGLLSLLRAGEDVLAALVEA
jgi:hypothetical protein